MVHYKQDGGKDHAFKLREKRIRRNNHNFYISGRRIYLPSVTRFSFIGGGGSFGGIKYRVSSRKFPYYHDYARIF